MPADAPYVDAAAGLDPHSEHPPLGKGLIAGRPVLGGIACAVGMLMKLPAALDVCGLALFIVLRPDRAGGRVAAVRGAVGVLAVTAAMSVAGLWILDVLATSCPSPLAHLQHMTSFGFKLTRSGGPGNSESAPWQWLGNEVQIPHLKVDTNVSVAGRIVLPDRRSTSEVR